MKKNLNIDYPVRVMCNHLFGETHTKKHRIWTGIGITISGVCIAKIHMDNFIAYLFIDLVGYGLHGLGLLPVFEHFVGLANEKQLEAVEAELTDVKHELSEVEGNVASEDDVAVLDEDLEVERV